MAISVDIINGQPVTGTTPTNTSKSEIGTDRLGKDAFLQLLVAQLQYQDPLNPSTNQEFLGELAQFTSLEELQNLTSTINSNNALTLVGKNVIIESGLSSGSQNTVEVAGYVEYVQMVDGKAMLSIDGQLYSADDLVTVVDDYYLSGVIGGGQKPETDGSANATESESGKTETEGTEKA